ncbi:MAG: YceI family protein [Chitinophagaceae bacterium]|nr:YceI family protein [Chitinophagaceae bacterium]
MKKQILTAVIILFAASSLPAQDKYFTKSGKIVFSSKTSMENIEAHNKSVTCVLDTKTGNMQFALLMKGFEFEKALMQEHFNENYAESHKFPKAEFKGQVINNNEISYTKDGNYTAKVKGKLTIHGETKEVETQGTITVKGGRIETDAVFHVTLADYKIEIPALVKDNISKTVSVTIDCTLDLLKS